MTKIAANPVTQQAESILRRAGFSEEAIRHLIHDELKGQKRCPQCGTVMEMAVDLGRRRTFCSDKCAAERHKTTAAESYRRCGS